VAENIYLGDVARAGAEIFSWPVRSVGAPLEWAGVERTVERSMELSVDEVEQRAGSQQAAISVTPW
jgi:hypothetical protein